jgi:hypothetical protein
MAGWQKARAERSWSKEMWWRQILQHKFHREERVPFRAEREAREIHSALLQIIAEVNDIRVVRDEKEIVFQIRKLSAFAQPWLDPGEEHFQQNPAAVPHRKLWKLLCMSQSQVLAEFYTNVYEKGRFHQYSEGWHSWRGLTRSAWTYYEGKSAKRLSFAKFRDAVRSTII